MSDQSQQRQPRGFDGKDTVWLAKPVDAYGDPIDKLTFRPPIGKDMRLCGLPFKLFTEDDRQYQAIDAKVILAFAARLGNVPPSTIDALSYEDTEAVMEAVTSFFARKESPATSSTVITMSPGDGVEILSPSSRSGLMSSSSLNDRRSA